MRDEMIVTHIVPGLNIHYGGTSESVVQLTDSLAKQSGIRVRLVTQKCTNDDRALSENKLADCYVATSDFPVSVKLGYPIFKSLKSMDMNNKPDIIHIHGLWTAASHWASAYSRKADIKLAIHPRGMLEPWALKHRPLKKRIAMLLYQKRNLASAKVLFATAEPEAESIRQLGFKQPVAIIPNGVIIPELRQDEFGFTKNDEKKKVLFLSRIHPKKGLLMLLEVWARVRPENCLLQIAGIDEDGHLEEVMQYAMQLNLDKTIDFTGPVTGESKSALYKQADLFVLPSFSENFGNVVTEALAHCLPVLTTHGTPWSELETVKCGWWVPATVDGIADALTEATKKDKNELKQMGIRGREFAKKFEWEFIAEQTTQTYRWILGHSEQPGFVITD